MITAIDTDTDTDLFAGHDADDDGVNAFGGGSDYASDNVHKNGGDDLLSTAITRQTSAGGESWVSRRTHSPWNTFALAGTEHSVCFGNVLIVVFKHWAFTIFRQYMSTISQ